MNALDYELLVSLHHQDLYRFAYSLSGNAADAADLTQETFYRLLTRGRQLRNPRKAKSWLFTTLYRIFLGWKRHESRFPHVELESSEAQLEPLTPNIIDEIDSALLMEWVRSIDERYRSPLVLFYLQGLAYREIAEILDVPIGTIMSRLARAKELLRRQILARIRAQSDQRAPIPMDPNQSRPAAS